MLYVLKRLDRVWYDETEGVVVRADTEAAARALASAKHGDEGAEPWLDHTRTSCDPLAHDGPAETILRAFNAG